MGADHFGYVGPVALGGHNRLVTLGMVRQNQMYLAVPPRTMLVLDSETRQVVASADFPATVFPVFSTEGWIEDFVYVGGDTIAFITGGNDAEHNYSRNLFIIHDPVFCVAEN